MMKLELQQINPRLLRSCYFDGRQEPLVMVPRTCYDYEFEFFLQSQGGIEIDNHYVPFAANDLSFKKPGQVIRGVAPYECYIFSIRVDGAYEKRDGYIFGWPETASPRYQSDLLERLGEKISLQDYPYITALFHELYIISQKSGESDQFHVNSILYAIFQALFSLSDPGKRRPQPVNQRVIRAINHIEIFYCDDVNIAGLIEKSGLSKAYFNKCFKEYTGTTPTEMIRYLRMERAKNLLCISNSSISEISRLCGYLDHVYFSHLFRKSTGFTPSAYRKLHSYR